ncbi:MAG: hypothetical protein HQP61_04880 [Peptococcaceae bacterium]|nr:hypothetical protein [Candidatus Syntrophopropionicum ammoniitolerans]
MGLLERRQNNLRAIQGSLMAAENDLLNIVAANSNFIPYKGVVFVIPGQAEGAGLFP